MNRSVIAGTVVNFAVLLRFAVVRVGHVDAADAVALLVDLVVDVVGGAVVYVAVLVEDVVAVVVCGVVRAAEECAVRVVLWCCAGLLYALST